MSDELGFDVGIELPDVDETQIWQDENEIREVALFLKTDGHRALGPECTPFQLPSRWTYDTLKVCIVDYIRRTVKVLDSQDIIIDQLYYKKSKGKALVLVNGDADISALLNEYPLTYRSGKKKKSSTMYMAVDYHVRSTGHENSHTFTSTPRRSPRIKSRNVMDIFVYEITAEKKVLSTANILHKVSNDISLNEVKAILKTYESESLVYTPTPGLYWLRKGNKQPVNLSTEQDFEACKNEYKCQNLRIACRAISLSESEGSTASSTCKRRRLDMGSSAASENELWNNTHVQLVRDLEKRGTLWRYSNKHLTLWTDQIVQGDSSGVNEEPDWEQHIEAVIIPPKSRRQSAGSPKDSNTSQPSFQNSLEMMIALDAKRNETLQSTLMLLLAAQTSALQVPKHVQQASEMTRPMPAFGKALSQMTVNDCINMMKLIGLANYEEVFEEKCVDGPMLEAFIHPSFGQDLMNSMGITHGDSLLLVPEIYRVKAHGYNSTTCTSTDANCTF